MFIVTLLVYDSGILELSWRGSEGEKEKIMHVTLKKWIYRYYFGIWRLRTVTSDEPIIHNKLCLSVNSDAMYHVFLKRNHCSSITRSCHLFIEA